MISENRRITCYDLHGSGVMGPKFLIVFVIMTMINTVVWQYAAAGL